MQKLRIAFSRRCEAAQAHGLAFRNKSKRKEQSQASCFASVVLEQQSEFFPLVFCADFLARIGSSSVRINPINLTCRPSSSRNPRNPVNSLKAMSLQTNRSGRVLCAATSSSRFGTKRMKSGCSKASRTKAANTFISDASLRKAVRQHRRHHVAQQRKSLR